MVSTIALITWRPVSSPGSRSAKTIILAVSLDYPTQRLSSTRSFVSYLSFFLLSSFHHIHSRLHLLSSKLRTLVKPLARSLTVEYHHHHHHQILPPLHNHPITTIMKFFASVCALSAVAVATLEPNKVEERQIGDPNIPYVLCE